LVGALLATVFGILLGFLSNRLRGPYFALATIAFSQVLLIVASRWRGFTSGSEGIPVPFRPGFWTLGITDKRVWVAIVLVLALVVMMRFAPQGLVPWVGERFRRRPAAGSTS